MADESCIGYESRLRSQGKFYGLSYEKAYVRGGKANQKLSATEIRDLVKRYTLPDFDQRTLAQDFKSLDLDVATIRRLNETGFHFGKIPERRIIEKLMVLTDVPP